MSKFKYMNNEQYFLILRYLETTTNKCVHSDLRYLEKTTNKCDQISFEKMEKKLHQACDPCDISQP